jgi:lipopolysaccharide export system protein LptA
MSLRPFAPPIRHGALSLLLAGALLMPAMAEKADRSKPMVVEADKPGSVDLQKSIVVFNGNVLISQGTMQIRADRVELRETPDGYRTGIATSAGNSQASYKQKRDGVDETVEGAADRIEFDGRSETLRFVGNGVVRRLRAGTPVDEITGALITWDHNAELFSVQGGTATPANPGGRIRAVLGPRVEPPVSAASAARPPRAAPEPR